MPLTKDQLLQQRYHITSMLGRGGMGAVYQAWDTRLNVPVAIKEMVPQPGLDPQRLTALRRQFQQEAQVLARLDHSHLVNVTDFFQENQNVYLVMKFIEGESLAQRIKRQGPLPVEEVLTLADQLLDALGYCHRQGIIHRDVKPQNVIIDTEGQAVLVDFGLVKFWDPSDPRTRTAIRSMGTPEYAPPEQYDAQLGHTDARSDVYGLGATLYHALTGKAPPTATQRVVNPNALPPIRQVRPDMKPEIAAVLMRAIELRPEARFPSTAAMAQALEQAIEEAAATPAPSPTAPPPPTRRAEPAPTPAPPAPPKAQKQKGGLMKVGGIGLLVAGFLCLLTVGGGILLLVIDGDGDGDGAVPITVPPTITVTATRSATVTPRPLPSTDTPLAATNTPPGASVMFEDSFDNPNSGWEVGDYDGGSVGYESGSYAISAGGDGKTMWGVSALSFDDAVIEVDATQISAPANNNNDYGVVCREQGNGDGYYLVISGDGAYAIIKSKNNEFIYLVEWSSSDAIRRGNATNRIRAICDDAQLTLFVNGTRLASVQDGEFDKGYLGLTATSYETDPTEIRFDNLTVREPVEEGNGN